MDVVVEYHWEQSPTIDTFISSWLCKPSTLLSQWITLTKLYQCNERTLLSQWITFTKLYQCNERTKENNLPYLLQLRWNHCRNSTVCNTTWLGNESQIQPPTKGAHCTASRLGSWMANSFKATRLLSIHSLLIGQWLHCHWHTGPPTQSFGSC